MQYNENNPAFPPPPIAFAPRAAGLPVPGQTLGHDEMAAILDSGFEEPAHPMPYRNGYAPAPNPSPLQNSTSFNFDDVEKNSGSDHSHGFEEGQYILPHDPNSANSISSSIESRAGGGGHAKKRSGGGQQKYGPLGPLADDDAGWGGPTNGGGRGRLI